MSFVVGIDLGTTFTGAAVARERGSDAMVVLGRRRNVMPSVVYLGPGGDDVAVGERAVRRLATDPGNVASLFKRDVGSETPWTLGGREVEVDELIAHVLRHALSTAQSEHGGEAERIALTFPASWGPLRQGVLVSGARAAGIDEPMLVTEPEAAAAFYAIERPVPSDALVAVFDFGGGTLDIAVLHRVADGFELLGTPTGDDELGGSNIDELLFDHVLRQIDDATQAELGSDLAARAALFWECVDAKETLSFDLDAEVACVTDSGRRLIRVTRDELEDLITPLVERSLDVLRKGLASAQVQESELHSVLLVGGSSRIPMIQQQLGATLPCTLAVDTDPKTSVALGAAKLAMADLRGTAPEQMLGDMIDLRIDGLGPAKLIGRGAYSVVYRARQESLDRDVAVKLITGAGFDLTARRRFEQECQAIGRLSDHPNIVSVHQSGVSEDRPPFIVMSYVPGGSYQGELEAGTTLSWPNAVEVGIKVASALEAAHEAGIFHCDVKPANVLLSAHGEPLLADFGLARVAERTGTQSITGIAGTPHYSPPEVFDGVPPAAERDVYGVAATVHSLIAGHPPIDVETESLLALMRHVATDEPEDLRRFGVPGPVADVVAKGLAKNPADRYPTAADFSAALAAALAEAQQAEEEPTPPPPGPAWWRSSRALAAVAAVVAIVVAALLVARPWGSDEAAPGTTSEPALGTTSEPALVAATVEPPPSSVEQDIDSPTTDPPTTADDDPPEVTETTDSGTLPDPDPPDLDSATELAVYEIAATAVGERVFEAIGALAHGSASDRVVAMKEPALDADPARSESALFALGLAGDDADVSLIGPVRDEQGEPYGAELAVAGLTVIEDGSLVAVVPGDRLLYRFDDTGRFIGAIETPTWIRPSADGTAGFIVGSGPAGVAGRPGESSQVVTIAERPLVQDVNAGPSTPVLTTLVDAVAPGLRDAATRGELTDEEVDELIEQLDPATVQLFAGEIVVRPTNGTITYDPDAARFSYSPNPGFVGIDQFSFVVSSGPFTVGGLGTVDASRNYLCPCNARVTSFGVEAGDPTREWAYSLDARDGRTLDLTLVDDRWLVVLEDSGRGGRSLYSFEIDEGIEPGGELPTPVDKDLISVSSSVFETEDWSSVTAGPVIEGRGTLILTTNSASTGEPTKVLVLALE